MYHYQINCQFLMPRTPFDAAIRDEIDQAASAFNQRSMTAKNPKQLTIVGYPDPYTMTVSLASREMLEIPSKALRLFSQLLVELDGCAKTKIQNGRVFVMSAAGRFDTPDEDEVDADVMLIHRLTKLLLEPKHGDNADKLARIRDILSR